MKTQSWSRGITPSFPLPSLLISEGDQRQAPAPYPQERDPLAIIQEAVWRPGRLRKNSPPPSIFFVTCPGFFPFDPFLYCLNYFVLHVTLRSMLPSLYNKHNTNIHAPGGIRTYDPSKRAAEDARPLGSANSIPGPSSP
jgi:hypothetical protein